MLILLVLAYEMFFFSTNSDDLKNAFSQTQDTRTSALSTVVQY